MKTLGKILLIVLLIGILLIGLAYAIGFNGGGQMGFENKFEMQTKELDVIENSIELKANLQVVSLDIQNSESGKNEIMYPVFESDNNKVEIKQDGNRIELVERHKKGLFRDIGINIGNFTPPKIVIKIAENTLIDNLDINMNVGSLDIEGAAARNGNISMDVGSLNIDKGDFSNVNFEADTGSINLNYTRLNNCSIHTSVGSIKAGIYPKGAIKFSSDAGSVNVETLDKEIYSVYLSSDLGSIDYDGNNYKGEFEEKLRDCETSIDMQTDIGSVSLKKMK